ncbi:MAG: DegT/DnrJ/EryC1/StrS family aminotransferase [Akkermansia sp.]|nr:DegT/DnrJ/EryC1/StrS family aminotransferase [Akkermansia sp.]
MNSKTHSTLSPITVTSPLLPDLGEFTELLQDIWQRKWLTNNGHYHKQLETALAEYLGVPYISLFTNGTLPLITALQALNLTQGEVITTPYSFVATTHALIWNGLTPVFADVDPVWGNLDPAAVEAAITDRTVAIMPVHVYGNPCDTEALQRIADKHGLKIIYDAAHAFGVKQNGRSILEAGDMSTLSFHATKVYNTVEGGALVCQTAEMKQHIDQLRNFGFTGETEVEAAGINSKMDEIRAAYGLLNLQQVDSAIATRERVAKTYRNALAGIPGIRCLQDIPGVQHNYAYFPIYVDAATYGRTRDELYFHLKEHGILARRYFYPVIPDFAAYANSLSARAAHIPNARALANSVICLPMHHELNRGNAMKILSIISIQ